MITMIDEIYDRGYQAGRPELHDGIEALVRKIRNVLNPALVAVHHFEWDAPWQAAAKPRH
jgi:hypothetical protein